MKKLRFLVLGMHCASCAASVERAVKKMDGVSNVYVNIATKTMTLNADDKVTPAMICETVKDNGYNAQLIEDKKPEPEDDEAGIRSFFRMPESNLTVLPGKIPEEKCPSETKNDIRVVLLQFSVLQNLFLPETSAVFRRKEWQFQYSPLQSAA